MLVQVALSLDTWTWNAEAYAASHRMLTPQTCCGEPRSTSSHCGSLDRLDQRVPGSPSVASGAGESVASWVEEAVVGWSSARSCVPQYSVGPVPPPPPEPWVKAR